MKCIFDDRGVDWQVLFSYKREWGDYQRHFARFNIIRNFFVGLLRRSVRRIYELACREVGAKAYARIRFRVAEY